jgi:hypothetical protein
MAVFVVGVAALTPVAVADTTGMTGGGYLAIKGGSSTQRVKILELLVGGQSTTSTVNRMAFARDSTVSTGTLSGAVGPTGNPFDPATADLAAMPTAGTTAATTQPQRDAAKYLLNLPINTYGGEIIWRPDLGREPSILGNTASFGEVSLSSISGTGVVGVHVHLEPM